MPAPVFKTISPYDASLPVTARAAQNYERWRGAPSPGDRFTLPGTSISDLDISELRTASDYRWFFHLQGSKSVIAVVADDYQPKYFAKLANGQSVYALMDDFTIPVDVRNENNEVERFDIEVYKTPYDELVIEDAEFFYFPERLEDKTKLALIDGEDMKLFLSDSLVRRIVSSDNGDLDLANAILRAKQHGHTEIPCTIDIIIKRCIHTVIVDGHERQGVTVDTDIDIFTTFPGEDEESLFIVKPIDLSVTVTADWKRIARSATPA